MKRIVIFIIVAVVFFLIALMATSQPGSKKTNDLTTEIRVLEQELKSGNDSLMANLLLLKKKLATAPEKPAKPKIVYKTKWRTAKPDTVYICPDDTLEDFKFFTPELDSASMKLPQDSNNISPRKTKKQSWLKRQFNQIFNPKKNK